MSYHRGDLIRIRGTWTDAGSVATDPTAVYAHYRDPSGNETTLQYGVDAALKRDSAGVYYVDVDADEAGTWQYYFDSTGTGQASSRTKSFWVNAHGF